MQSQSKPIMSTTGTSSPPPSSASLSATTALAAADTLIRTELFSGTRTSATDGRSIQVERPALGLIDLPIHASIGEGGYFTREAAWITELDRIRTQAASFISLVYAYRGCFKAVPTFNGASGSPTSPVDGSSSEQAKTDYYRLVEKIVKPEVAKMKQLMEFYTSAATALSNVCKDAAASLAAGQPPTESLLVAIASTMDMLMVLDSLKNVKTSLNNDFTLIFRRSRSISKTQGDDKENQMLYLFLANKDVFLGELKSMAAKVPNMDDLLWELASAMADRLERGHWAHPKEKYALVKAAAYAMVMLDPVMLPKALAAKHWRTERISRMFRLYPVLPLYGDLAVTTAQLLQRTVNQKWDMSPLPTSKDGNGAFGAGGAAAAESGEDLIPIAETRVQVSDYLAKLGLALATVRRTKADDMIDAQCKDVFDTLVEGVQLLNHLTTLVLEMNAFKYTHPTNHSSNPDYERFALAEVLSLLKSLEDKLLRAHVELGPATIKHISCFMNTMQQMSLTNMVAYTTKKKKPTILAMLKSLAELVGPNMHTSQSIMYMAHGLDKELKDSHVAELQAMQNQMFWIQQVHALPVTLRKTVDLSELWYKEFYLELAKQIQFPIETSLPWILINTMLDSSAVDLTHSLFLPFSIYDDAANRALHDLKMHSKVFKAYKCHAAAELFAVQYKVKLDKTIGLEAPFHHHEWILSHYKTVHILGRCIPFTQVLSQMLNMAFRQSMEAILSRFESSDITGVLEYSYNGITDRFVRNPIPMAEPGGAGAGRAATRQHKHEYLYGTKALHQAYSAQLAPYLLFVGKHHFDAIIKVVGSRLPLLFSEIVDAFEASLRDKLTPYLWVLSKEFPNNVKLPGLDYGVVGTFEYFQVILKALIAFKDLTTVFQTLRELGNLFLCVRFLEQSTASSDVLNAYHLAKSRDMAQDLTKLFNLPPITDPTHAHLLSPRSGHALALCSQFLNTLHSIVTNLCPLWSEGLPASTSYDTSRELYRVASFLQFSFCSGSSYTKGFTCREVFGDSVHWALGLLLSWTRQMDVFIALDFTYHVCYAGKVLGIPNGPIPTLQSGVGQGGGGAAGALHTSLADFIHLGEYYKSVMVHIDRYYRSVVGNEVLQRQRDEELARVAQEAEAAGADQQASGIIGGMAGLTIITSADGQQQGPASPGSAASPTHSRSPYGDKRLSTVIAVHEIVPPQDMRRSTVYDSTGFAS
ncbi:cytoplasmic fragile-X interacting family-domain-containing protein [Catenaria anguillulae PL171]|uniref:Cytoplasmic fragile-X interacting family-domain-containing protein n=1 Tax=Catenaria anguillulae PL171 TaxID=765915 RepID=A0A1Y2HQA0_9FUNG|nr:cytoplasmic fragile-X interacting family-domain-containing protein [Catenaria anguillulae PL171]